MKVSLIIVFEVFIAVVGKIYRQKNITGYVHFNFSKLSDGMQKGIVIRDV